MANKVKVPVIMQMEAVECGAASLCMVLAYYKKWMPLPEVRTEMGVSRDGVSALHILKTARKYGLEAKGYRYQAEKLEEKVTLPCILFWRGEHFVVLTGFSKKGFHLNDPATGPRLVPKEQFENDYSGIVLTFTPTEAFVPSGRQASVLAFAKKRLTGAGAGIAFISLAGLASAFFGIAQPLISQAFIDKILSGASPVWMMPLIGALVGLGLARFLLQAANSSYSTYIQGKFAVTANNTYIQHILRLPMRFFSQRMAGDIANRQQQNATVAQTLINTLTPIGVGVLTMVVYLIIMLSISPLLTLIGLSSLLINIFVAQIISKKRVNISRAISRDSGALYGKTASILSVMETIKASGAEEGMFSQWTGAQAKVMAGQTKISRLNSFLGSVPNLLGNLSNAALLAVGTLLIIRGELTSGMLLSMQSLLQSFMTPSQQLITAGQEISEMRTSMERIEDVMEHEEDPVFTYADDEAAFERISGHISIRNITFGYSTQAPPLIENFSLELTPGRKVALVGGSGCGKSTLSKLVAGIYQPWSGEILYDGRPISSYDRTAFTSAIAVVDQDIFLFPESISDNFRFADGTLSDVQIVNAAKDACIHDAIVRQEDGYDTMLSEGGKNLSGGQRQQMEIARALAGEPAVIILDEATSALDAQTEAQVMTAIKNRGITMLMVAHRLSTIRDADEILVMENGVVIERGTHEELLALGGAYTRLVSTS